MWNHYNQSEYNRSQGKICFLKKKINSDSLTSEDVKIGSRIFVFILLWHYPVPIIWKSLTAVGKLVTTFQSFESFTKAGFISETFYQKSIHSVDGILTIKNQGEAYNFCVLFCVSCRFIYIRYSNLDSADTLKLTIYCKICSIFHLFIEKPARW